MLKNASAGEKAGWSNGRTPLFSQKDLLRLVGPLLIEQFLAVTVGMADKDVDEMLALLLPLAKRFVTVAAHTPRAMPAETLAEHIRARGGKAEAAADIPAGVARAVELGGDGPVCALGTLYFSGDVRQAFARLTAE